jgi:hypothetical protein
VPRSGRSATFADPRNIAELLDGISGAHERARLGRAQADAGDTIPLEKL